MIAGRGRFYLVAGAVGAIAGEAVASVGAIFLLALLPEGKLWPALLLLLGLVGGAAAGVLLLRRWYRGAGEQGGASGAPSQPGG